MIVYDKNDEITLGDLGDIHDNLKVLKDRAMKANSDEENLQIWKVLQEIAADLENPKVMKLPYAKKYYPLCLPLCDEIRAQLKMNLELSPNKPKNWRLYRGE